MTDTLGQEIAATIADALVGVDTAGTIQFWNPAAERLLGFSADHAIGQTLAILIPPQARPGHMAGFHRAMETGRLDTAGEPVQVTSIRADGTTVELEMTLAVRLDGTGTPSGAVAALRSAGRRRPISHYTPTAGK